MSSNLMVLVRRKQSGIDPHLGKIGRGNAIGALAAALVGGSNHQRVRLAAVEIENDLGRVDGQDRIGRDFMHRGAHEGVRDRPRRRSRRW